MVKKLQGVTPVKPLLPHEMYSSISIIINWTEEALALGIDGT
jgi:hypothetical protein